MICSMKYDARVDLWSVGVILYGELLSKFQWPQDLPSLLCATCYMYIVVSIDVHNNMSTLAKSSVSLQQMYYISFPGNYHNDYKVTLNIHTEQVLAAFLYISCFQRDSLFISASQFVSHSLSQLVQGELFWILQENCWGVQAIQS